MENHILQFIWRHSRREQIHVVLLTLMAFPLLYLTLEIPKWVINNALGDTQSTKILFGFSLQPVEYLAALCFGLMVLIIASGLLKMTINTYKGIIGERLIRRLRFSLMERLLRFPLHHYSAVSPGEMISTVSSETEPLAGYIGESIALPLFQGGTMITILVFMFAQNWVFGLVSLVLIPIQGYLIPRIQRQINLLKKDRIRRVRKLSERIGETVSGASEIRLHGTEKYTLAEFSRRFGDLFWVRLEIFRKKYYMKFLNNTIGQITPFLYYLFGGYLVIRGSLTVGALVAAIAAYKDLTSPWRELLNHYQLHEDAKIKYQQIVAMFDIKGLTPTASGFLPKLPDFLDLPLVVEQLGWTDGHGHRLLDDVSLQVERGNMVAISGGGGAQRTKLTELLSALDRPQTGSIRFGEHNLQEIPNNLLRTRLAVQGPDPHIFSGSIVENMEYGLNQREPFIEIEDSLNRDVLEAESSGNVHPLTTDWVDYRIASNDQGVLNRDWYTRVMETVGAHDLIYKRSLFESFDPLEWPDLAKKLLTARSHVSDELANCELMDFVSPFDNSQINESLTVLENIFFGTLKKSAPPVEELVSHPWILESFQQCGALESAISLGHSIARRLQTLRNDLSVDDELLIHFGIQDAQQADEIVQALDAFSSFSQSRRSTHNIFLSIFLKFIPGIHPFTGLDNQLTTALLKVRKQFQSEQPQDLVEMTESFDQNKYHSGLSVRDNLLFGRWHGTKQESTAQLGALISKVVDQLDIRTDLMILFGESQVGVSGANLSVPERHTIALGRALMKRPDLLIFHDALSPFDEEERHQLLERIRTLLPGITIIWIDQRLPNNEDFTAVYRLTERGYLENTSTSGSGVYPETETLEPASPSADYLSLISHAILFTPLSASQKRFLADHSSLIAFDRDSTIYCRGDIADAVWLVVNGKVESHRGEQHIGSFIEHDVFGSIEILADRDRMLTLRTVTKSTLLRIDGNALNRIASGNATVSRNLLRALTQQWGHEGST